MLVALATNQSQFRALEVDSHWSISTLINVLAMARKFSTGSSPAKVGIFNL